MAKKKVGRPSKNRQEVTARIDADIMRKVKYLASTEKITIGEYLSNLLEPIVGKKYRDRLAKEIRQEGEDEKGAR